MDQTPDDLLQLLFTASLKELLNRVQSGEASASDLAVAAKMLKDNNITADPTKNDSLKELRDQLGRRQERNVQNRVTARPLVPTTEAEKQAAIDDFMGRLQ